MAKITVRTDDINFYHAFNDTIKDYLSEKVIHHTVNSVGPTLLNVSQKELNSIFNIVDLIGERASCTFDNELYLMKNNIFTSENINIVHTYCSQQALIKVLPTERFGTMLTKNLFLESFKPQYNFKSIDTSIIEKIHSRFEYMGFVGSFIYKLPHNGFHYMFDQPIQNVIDFGIDTKNNITNFFYPQEINEPVLIFDNQNQNHNFNNNSILSYENQNFNEHVIHHETKQNTEMTFNHDHVFVNSEQELNHDHVFVNSEQGLIDIDQNENSQDINTTNNENELVIACDAINLIGLIKHNTTDLKHVLCYTAKLFNDFFTKDIDIRSHINFAIQLAIEGKIRVEKVFNYLFKCIAKNPYVNIAIDAMDQLFNKIDMGTVIKNAAIALSSLYIPIIGQIALLYDTVMSFLSDSYQKTVHTLGLDVQIQVQELFRFFGHNKFVGRVDSELFNIHINESIHASNDQSLIELITQKWNAQFEINAYVYTGIYYSLYDNDKEPLVGLYNKIAFKMFIENLIENWTNTVGLTPEQKEKYLAYLNKKSNFDVNFLDIINYLIEKYIHHNNDVIFPNSENKTEGNYWDKHNNENPFLFLYHLFFPKSEEAPLTDDEFMDLCSIVRKGKLNIKENVNNLENYQSSQKSDLDNHIGNYTRLKVIIYQNKELLLNDISTGLLVNNLFSAISSLFINTYFLNEDEHEKTKHKDYLLIKKQELQYIYTQSYLTRVLTSHLSVSIGMLPFADGWTDDFFNDVFVPHVGLVSSFFVSALTINNNGEQQLKQKIGNVLMNSLKVNSYHVSKSIYKIIHAKSLIKGSHILWAKIVKVVEYISAKCSIINNFCCFNIIAAAASFITTIGISKLLQLMTNNDTFENKMNELKIKKLKKIQKKINYQKKLLEKSQDKYSSEADKNIAKKEFDSIHYWNNYGNEFKVNNGFECKSGFTCMY
jgi:hypothetical protein